jgi:hypothetical protein
MEGLVREPASGVLIAARPQVKGDSLRDVRLTKELAAALEEWFAFLESVKGVRLRSGGVDFAGSPLVFPVGTARHVATTHSTLGSNSLASELGCWSFLHIPCGIRPRRSCCGGNLRDVQVLLGHKSLVMTARYKHVDSEGLRSLIGNLRLDS